MDQLIVLEIEKNLKYLQLLSKQFPNISTASREIINLQAIINLPKGTEHLLSDLHGESEAFLHIMKNGSGIIRRKIEDVFGNKMRQQEKNSLATLIYYPEEILVSVQETEKDIEDWWETMLHRLVVVCREVSSKYTRSKVRKVLPKDFEYIIEELLHEQDNVPNKYDYYDGIIKTIIRTGQAKPFIIAISELIQRLAIDRLHILGDIYDRGPGAHIIMDKLMSYHSLDIQWGNHDIGWLGSAAGSMVCIANTVRQCARYANFHILEDGYGINLMPLAQFAMATYGDTSESFKPKQSEKNTEGDFILAGKIQKAISIIQFKLEGQFILRHPEYLMEDRLLLSLIDYEKGLIRLQGKEYALLDTEFPTIDPFDPYRLTETENEVIQKLKRSFMQNDKLQKHMNLMLAKGSIYLAYNDNLLFHGCIPMDAQGEFQNMKFDGVDFKGKALLDKFERMVRESYEDRFNPESHDTDIFWYLYTGEKSSLFGKKKITTFERYFVADAKTHVEEKNDYYKLINNQEICIKILEEFGLTSENAKIINGHVPVKVKKGESPIKAGGKLLVIDGGFSKAYQGVTGIAGYTLIYNSYGMILAAHEPFESKENAIKDDKDIISKLTNLSDRSRRIKVGDTDNGKILKNQINDLELLLVAFKKGIIKQV